MADNQTKFTWDGQQWTCFYGDESAETPPLRPLYNPGDVIVYHIHNVGWLVEKVQRINCNASKLEKTGEWIHGNCIYYVGDTMTTVSALDISGKATRTRRLGIFLSELSDKLLLEDDWRKYIYGNNLVNRVARLIIRLLK